MLTPKLSLFFYCSYVRVAQHRRSRCPHHLTSDAAVSVEAATKYRYFNVKTRASAENLLKPTQPNQRSPHTCQVITTPDADPDPDTSLTAPAPGVPLVPRTESCFGPANGLTSTLNIDAFDYKTIRGENNGIPSTATVTAHFPRLSMYLDYYAGHHRLEFSNNDSNVLRTNPAHLAMTLPVSGPPSVHRKQAIHMHPRQKDSHSRVLH